MAHNLSPGIVDVLVYAHGVYLYCDNIRLNSYLNVTRHTAHYIILIRAYTTEIYYCIAHRGFVQQTIVFVRQLVAGNDFEICGDWQAHAGSVCFHTTLYAVHGKCFTFGSFRAKYNNNKKKKNSHLIIKTFFKIHRSFYLYCTDYRTLTNVITSDYCTCRTR